MGKILDCLKDYFANTSEEQFKKDWDEIEKYNSIGVDVDEYIGYVKNIKKNEEIMERKAVYKKLVVYISGKISGLNEKECAERFEKAKEKLESIGFVGVTPFDVYNGYNKDWGYCMIKDLEYIMKCDAIYMLNNYEESDGAIIELKFAKRIGLITMFE